MTIFLMAFGKSGYLNMALLEAIFTSNFGIVVSVNFPFTFPFTVKSPEVSTLLISPE